MVRVRYRVRLRVKVRVRVRARVKVKVRVMKVHSLSNTILINTACKSYAATIAEY